MSWFTRHEIARSQGSHDEFVAIAQAALLGLPAQQLASNLGAANGNELLQDLVVWPGADDMSTGKSQKPCLPATLFTFCFCIFFPNINGRPFPLSGVSISGAF